MHQLVSGYSDYIRIVERHTGYDKDGNEIPLEEPIKSLQLVNQEHFDRMILCSAKIFVVGDSIYHYLPKSNIPQINFPDENSVFPRYNEFVNVHLAKLLDNIATSDALAIANSLKKVAKPSYARVFRSDYGKDVDFKDTTGGVSKEFTLSVYISVDRGINPSKRVISIETNHKEHLSDNWEISTSYNLQTTIKSAYISTVLTKYENQKFVGVSNSKIAMELDSVTLDGVYNTYTEIFDEAQGQSTQGIPQLIDVDLTVVTFTGITRYIEKQL